MQEKDYTEYSVKYTVPTYADLNDEFEIQTIENGFILREICRRIQEELDEHVHLLENVVQPNPDSAGAMHECSVLTNAEKKTSYEIYKTIMYLLRAIDVALLSHDEKQEAQVILESYTAWHDIRKNLIPIVNHLKESWKQTTPSKQKMEYFG